MLLALASSVALAVTPQDWSFDDPAAGPVDVRVYVPDGPGPFPLAVFLHGWLGQAWMYDGACSAIAEQGHVVVSLDTETGAWLDMDAFALDAVAALRWAETSEPLVGLVDDADRIALGHSMGGATLMHLVDVEPRIRTAVAFMPYEGYGTYYDRLETWDGSLLVLSGSHDTTAPPALQHAWMDAADATARSLLVELPGFGHTAITDLTWDDEPVPDAEQHVVLVELATAFLAAEHRGDEQRWADLVARDATLMSRSQEPAIWATATDGQVVVGVAGDAGATAAIHVGHPDEVGAPIASLPLPSGVGEATFELPEDLDGDVWAWGVVDDATTRAVLLQAESPLLGDDPEPEPVAASRDTGGCTTAAGPGPGLAWLAALAWRKRSGSTRR